MTPETGQIASPGKPLPPWVRVALGNVAVALVYVLAGTAALLLARGTGLASPVWPAAGVAFALVFVRGAAYLPGVFIGSVATNLPALLRGAHGDGVEIAIASAIAAGAALGALAGSLIVRRAVGRRPPLTNASQILVFLVLAGPLTGAITASISTTVLLAGGVISQAQAPLSWFTWWIGDTIGIVVFAPIVMMLLPEQADVWRGRQWKIAVPSIVVLVVAVFTVLQNAGLIIDQRSMVFRQEAHDATESLERELTTHTELLAGVAGLRSASQYVSQEEFASFTRPFLTRHRALQAVSWNPIIKAGQRAAYEAEQRSQPALADFRITERSASGELVPAGARPEYVTVGYIEPLAANKPALGFDVYSSPVRADAIDRARRLGTLQATAPVELVQETGTQQGVLIFLPTQGTSREVEGFAVGVYRMTDLLLGAVGDPKWKAWNFALTDATDNDHPLLLAERVAEGDNPGQGLSNPAAITRRMEFGGRVWNFTAWPSQALVAALPPATPMLLLSGTLAIVFLLEAFLLLVTGHERRWRSHAVNSSYAAHHDDLTGLLNRRGFFEHLRMMQTAREELHAVGAAEYSHALMFLDLDGFKPVNDRAGHDAGDEMLRQVAQALKLSARAANAVGRIGGDEFAILVHDCTPERGVEIATAVQRAVAGRSISWHGVRYSVGVSIGLTGIVPASTMSIDDLLRQADEACYGAKHAGRNTVRVFEATQG